MSNENKKNVLVMISTHGTWSSTHLTKVCDLREHYQKACEKVKTTLESLKDTQLWLGYDGDAVQQALVPPTLLLLMLINTFLSVNPKLIQCQGANYNDTYGYDINSFESIATHLENEKIDKLAEIFGITKSNNIINILKETKNITLAYTPKKEEEEEEEKIIPHKDEQNTTYNFVTYDLQLHTPGDKYGGVVDGKLVDSTRGWDFYFKNTPKDAPKFDNVYYLPVWNDECSKDNKKWSEATITKQIAEACQSKSFKNGDKEIKVIDGFIPDEYPEGFGTEEFNAGGGRSRKRTAKKIDVQKRKISEAKENL